MKDKRILVVDDEENILELVNYNLVQEGYQIYLASSGKQTLNKVKEILPDLIILDIMLPELDGFEICRKLQEEVVTQRIPIIFLSAKTDVEDKVEGLELGATDYLTKPFSPRELVSRVRVILKRLNSKSSKRSKDHFKYGGLTLDLRGHRVLFNGQEVDLTNKEFDLLNYLLDKLGKACSRDEILEKVWGYETFSSIRTVDVHIRMLRKKFTKYNIKQDLIIETIRGFGYKLVCNNNTKIKS
ncbi:response regulator transcription factor [Selenihalanaerobacter shriftii]|uniref:Stage 0 sporulation protein A homolog n=1 Tax=Selenihalanaerobacter shriftii TaxID=142842 RepID=A0A1T4JKK1_9FIRM|nr:response regulator transcription factor [Selenihalanaerobacter shriftii]SJZ30709.1 two-component system, OmpR family, alkaline phosphatase synthesis response regulator PhoP [Selenihalanaerobacter shriftii]